MGNKDKEVRISWEQVEEMELRGVFGENVNGGVFGSLVERTRRGGFSFGVRGDFSLDNKPENSIGVSLCYMCGWVYFVTPRDDAYEVQGREGDGKVCLECLTMDRL